MDFIDRYRKKKKRPVDDILLNERTDRRLLPDVPDLTGGRRPGDRRGRWDDTKEEDMERLIKQKRAGIRYQADGFVEIHALKMDGGGMISFGRAVDISTTGILVRLPTSEPPKKLIKPGVYRLRFKISGGAVPEGGEMKVRNLSARLVRFAADENGGCLCGFEFAEDLSTYASRRKDRYMLMAAAMFLFFVSAMIVLMRAESVIYFKFNRWTYLHDLVRRWGDIGTLARNLGGGGRRPSPGEHLAAGRLSWSACSGIPAGGAPSEFK